MTPEPETRPLHAPTPTASRLDLARACPGSFALPHHARETPQATKGTLIHEYLALLINQGLAEPERVMGPEARAVCAGVDPAEVLEICGFSGADAPAAEVAFAYDPVRGDAVALEAGPAGASHRDYSRAPEGWVCGTADAVAVGEDRVLITDWKTGAYAVAPPERNPQLRFLALAAARAHGAREAAAQVVYVDRRGRLSASAAEFGSEELERIASEVRATLRSVGLARLRAQDAPHGFSHAIPDPRDLKTGAHCRLCPAFSGCPAQAGAAQALLRDKDATLTERKVAEAWATLQAVEAATRRVRATLAAYVAASGGSLELPGGKALRLVESRREKIDAERALPLLRGELGFGERADGAVSVSKTALGKLAGSDLPGVMAALEEAGAVEVSHSESLRETGPR